MIFAAGTGNPFFTTDTGAALRAAEMNCDAPAQGYQRRRGLRHGPQAAFEEARRFETITYSQVLADNLKVMDASAVALCRENDIPIVVFSIREKGNVVRVLARRGGPDDSPERGDDMAKNDPKYDKADLERRMGGRGR